MATVRLITLLGICLSLLNCAKGKSGGTAATAPSVASNTAGQTIVCPVSGYYLYNGTNVACVPGQTIVVGNNTLPAPTTTPTPLPAPAPQPVPTGVPPQNSCEPYAAQYNGVIYVVAYYQGQYVCMREDLAAYYGLAVY